MGDEVGTRGCSWRGSARRYECAFLIRPDLSQDQVRAIVREVEDFIGSQGGSVHVREAYLPTQLSRQVKKQKRGVYVVLNVECSPEVMQVLAGRMRVVQCVLLSMISRVEAFESGPTSIGRSRGGYARQDREAGGSSVGGGGSQSESPSRDWRGGGAYGRRSYGPSARSDGGADSEAVDGHSVRDSARNG